MKKITIVLMCFLLTAGAAMAQNEYNEENLEISTEYSVNGVSFKMILVEGGTYTMGSPEEGDQLLQVGSIVFIINEKDREDRPSHNVTVSSFYIGQTEVTQELWEAVMGKNPSFSKGAKRPVDQVSWNDCQKFIKKLNNLTGKNFRLPTEEEWEYAARGGKKSQNYQYAGSNNADDVAWHQFNCNFNDESSSDFGTHPVATKLANELGIFDMSGNVSEWCQNKWYKYNGGKCNSSYRTYRGGNFGVIDKGCRVWDRPNQSTRYRTSGVGLRLAL